MADEEVTTGDEVVVVEEETPEIEGDVSEEVGAEAADKAEPEATDKEDDPGEEGEFVVSIGDDSPPPKDEEAQQEYAWGKMRRENRELKTKLEQYTQKEPAAVEVGQEPGLYDDGIDGDEDKFRTATQSWLGRKADADKAVEAEKEVEADKSKAWQGTLSSFNEKREAVKAKMSNYEELEGVVDDSLSEIQKGAILQCAKDPALLIAALGNNPAKLKELSSMKDAAGFIWAASQMESQMKVGSRKVATKPESKVKGSTVSTNALDSTLAKLEKEADKSGDRSKVLAYKRSKRE